MSAAPVIVDIRHIGKSYRRGSQLIPVLEDISLTIAAAEFLALMGPSGSGKSTLLNLIAGLDRADSGTIYVGGVDISALPESQLAAWRAAHVGFIFQFYNLIPSLTARENVALVTDIVADPMDPADALTLVGLGHRLDHFPAQLSGGEQQRVAMARAIAKRPDVLLCDEPTGALDYETGKLVLAAIARVNSELGTTIVIITHNSAIE
jgi:putative ABC transport system ATP-binding protein